MPTYEYACRSCGEHLEVVQSFRDEPLTTCPACGSALRKVFGSIGVVFKGSGFYKNDSRPAAKESSSSSKEPATSTASDSGAASGKATDGAGSAKETKSSDSSSGSGSSDKSSSTKSPPSEKSGTSSEKSSPSAAAS